jgi:predicted nuclease of predicted toxin-antitoxin system
MKILIDENLPPKLRYQLADLFPEMHHVRDLGRKAAADSELWHFAVAEDYAAILTTDIDFQNRVLELGQPPKVIRIDRCNFSARETTVLLRREAVRIIEFLQSTNALLVLHR